MKLAIFQQVFPVADSKGRVRCVFAVDTNGDIWLRHNLSVGNFADWAEWELFGQPERAPPLDAWDTLLEAQERLRAEGREVEVIEKETGEIVT